jgi:DNA-directed RNA polymerase alpha subunit
MTKEELLDHFATAAMQAQIEKMGITNPFALAQTAYRMAKEMIEHRDRICQEWKQEEERQRQYATADLYKLNLPVRYHRCLISEDIYTIERLQEWTDRDLRKIPNLGMKGLKLIKEAMLAHGLKLKGQE